jgi:hypothetical protein
MDANNQDQELAKAIADVAAEREAGNLFDVAEKSARMTKEQAIAEAAQDARNYDIIYERSKEVEKSVTTHYKTHGDEPDAIINESETSIVKVNPNQGTLDELARLSLAKRLSNEHYFNELEANPEHRRLFNDSYHVELSDRRAGKASMIESIDDYMASRIEKEMAAKEERKQAEFAALQDERRERAAAWTPEEAASQARLDAAVFREETDKAERFYKASDMTANADANPHYREALDREAPEVSKDVAAEIESNKTVVINPTAQAEQAQADEARQGRAFYRVKEYQGPEDYDGIEHRFEKLDDAIAKAEALGKTNIDAYDETGKWHPVERGDDGEWRHGKSLAEQGYFTPPKAVEVEPMTINQADLDRVAAVRARDTAQAREALGLNTVEPNIEKERQQLSEAQDAQRAAWLKQAEADAPKPQAGKAPGDNKVESDEIFTATQSEVKPAIPPDVEKQYLHVGNKFYHPRNTNLVAFEDKGNKLETKSNSEAIAGSMVRIAETRGWDEIKVSGSETFRKEVWLEAASRGMHVKGYSPSEQDRVELAKRIGQAEANKVEKGAAQFRGRENDREDKQAFAKGRTPHESKSVDTAAVLVAHGAAKYLHDEKNSDSYYVITRDAKGQEKTSWGVDLERAVNE